MVQDQLIARGIQDRRVIAAMRRIPRHLFIDSGLVNRAYDDSALPIGREADALSTLHGCENDRSAGSER